MVTTVPRTQDIEATCSNSPDNGYFLSIFYQWLWNSFSKDTELYDCQNFMWETTLLRKFKVFLLCLLWGKTFKALKCLGLEMEETNFWILRADLFFCKRAETLLGSNLRNKSIGTGPSPSETGRVLENKTQKTVSTSGWKEQEKLELYKILAEIRGLTRSFHKSRLAVTVPER